MFLGNTVTPKKVTLTFWEQGIPTRSGTGSVVDYYLFIYYGFGRARKHELKLEICIREHSDIRCHNIAMVVKLARY